MNKPTRIEHDLVGDRQVPAAAYYGVHTLRALENFPITGTAISIYPDLIQALACAIVRACEEIRGGALLEEFVVDVIQGATAIGTGINVHPEYAVRVTRTLSEIAGVELMVSPNLIEATQDAGPFVQLSGVLKRVAVKLSKVCNDLRLLDDSTALVTALNPYIGYARSSEIAREALATGRRVYDLVLEKKLMTREDLDAILRPEVLTRPHFSTVHRPKGDA